MKLVACASVLLVLLTGCHGGGAPVGTSGMPGPPMCAAGQEMFQGACVDPAERYEPAQRLDTNNVVAEGTLTQLHLPPPPKSGFRIIAPTRTLQPGEEDEICLSWPFPQFTNHVIYAGRLYSTTGLHHSNLIDKPVDPTQGPQPYPNCHPGASDPFSQLPQVIPDVLFANSTQVVGQETMALPPGMGFTVDPTREILTDIHYLNTTSEVQETEVAYDFFTMPEADLVNEVAPFFLSVQEFDIPPHTTGNVGTTCPLFGGNIVETMPHTHQFATAVTADLIHDDGTDQQIVDDGPFDAKSHIVIHDPPIDLTNVAQISFQCTFDNTTDHDIVWGIGSNEMCILFGYMYPVRQQFIGYSPDQGQPCQGYDIGLFR